MPYLRISKMEFEKTFVTFEISTFELVKMQKFVQKKPFHIWDQKCLKWVFLVCNFEKLLSYLKSGNSSLSKCKVSGKTIKL